MSKEKQMFEDMAEAILEDYTRAYSRADKECLARYIRTKYDEYTAGYRKQSEGEWKQTIEPLGAHDVDCVECSVCGESWVLDEDFDYDVVKDFWNYCPNCGAKMKGGAE